MVKGNKMQNENKRKGQPKGQNYIKEKIPKRQEKRGRRKE